VGVGAGGGVGLFADHDLAVFQHAENHKTSKSSAPNFGQHFAHTLISHPFRSTHGICCRGPGQVVDDAAKPAPLLSDKGGADAHVVGGFFLYEHSPPGNCHLSASVGHGPLTTSGVTTSVVQDSPKKHFCVHIQTTGERKTSPPPGKSSLDNFGRTRTPDNFGG